MPIGHLTGKSAETRYRLSKAGEYSFAAIGLPVAAAGALVVTIMGLLVDTDTVESNHPSRDRDQLLITGGALTGVLLVWWSHELSQRASEVSPEVYVSLEKEPASDPAPDTRDKPLSTLPGYRSIILKPNLLPVAPDSVGK